METLKDDNVYPLLILSRNLRKYLKYGCPCIVYFQDKSDNRSNKLSHYVHYISKKHPKVLCFKVGWKSYLKKFQNLNQSKKYDVTIWRHYEKYFISYNPSLAIINDMFINVYNLLLGQDNEIYLNYLKSTRNIYIKIQINKEKKRKNQFLSKKTPVAPYIYDKLDSLFVPEEKSKIQVKYTSPFVKNKLSPLYKEVNYSPFFTASTWVYNQKALMSNSIGISKYNLNLSNSSNFISRIPDNLKKSISDTNSEIPKSIEYPNKYMIHKSFYPIPNKNDFKPILQINASPFNKNH